MKTHRKLTALGLSLAMACALLAGCGPTGNQPAADGNSPVPGTAAPSTPAAPDAPTTPTDTGEPVYGGSITMYWNDDIDTYFDPAIGDTVSWNLFLEGLWSYDVTSGHAAIDDNVPGAALKGQLAESWTVDEAAATLTVTLRDDVHFQRLDDQYDYYGGRQLVAGDVKWTYDRLCGIGSGYDAPLETESNWARNLAMLVSVDAPDDQTVVFHLTSGDEVTIESFMNQFVKIGGPEWDTLTDDQKSDYHYCCGTGPFLLSEIEAGQRVVLTRNDDYYDYDVRYPDNKLPYLDQITVLYIADSTNIVTQFTSGNLDLFGSSKTNLVNDSEAAQIAASGMAYYVNSVASSQPEFLVMKCNQKPFDDIRVRQAMQLAIDMNTIHSAYLNLEGDMVLSGLWNPVTTEWSTVSGWPQELLDSYSYDPERAKALLAEAGYADGLTFDAVITSENDADLWALAAEYWNAVGIKVNLEVVSNFMEAKTIGNNADDPRSMASAGAGAVASIQAAFNQTVDGGWAAGMWNGDAAYTELFQNMMSATSLADQERMAKEADQMYAEGHWTVNLTGMRALNYFYNARVDGIPDNCSIYSGKAASTLLSGMWVTDAQ